MSFTFGGELNYQVFGTLALLGGPLMFLKGFRELRMKRLIDNTPTARIRSMAMGLVELNGKVEARSTILAPFSGRACTYWQVDIAVRGRRKDGWHIVHRNSSGNPFFLNDGTGTAMVYPRGADCRVANGVEEECMGLGLPQPYAEYLEEHRPPMGALWRMGAMRFRERILEEGQHVYVLGTCMPRARAYVVSEGEAAAATGTDGLDAWQARRIAKLQDDAVGIIRQGEHEKVFIISPESERQLTLWLGLKAHARLLAGPALALAGLAYWLDWLRRMNR